MTPAVASLGARTDLALLVARGSTVEECATHRVVRTPDNPAFRWGNFVQVLNVPSPAAADHWREVFAKAFPEAAYGALGVDVPSARLDEEGWRGVGFEPNTEVVLTAAVDPLARALASSALPLRRIEGDRDWDAVLRWERESDEVDEPGHDQYLALRVGAHRRATEAGTGAWFGAFDGAEMAAGLGLFVTPDGDARYQHVGTRADWRRGGLMTALLRRAAAEVGLRRDVRRLVIVADVDGPAVELYRRAGFADAETSAQLESASPARAPTDDDG